MKWQRRQRSRHLEDRRARRAPRRVAGRSIGLGGLLAIVAVSWLLGVDPLPFLSGVLSPGSDRVDTSAPTDVPEGDALRTTPREEELVDFVSFVLDDLQQTWAELMPGYRPATLILFRGATQSACGVGQSEMGPFYCPADQNVYVDLDFYEELRGRFGAPGDFAQAYVLAHEIGHHIQTLNGTSDQVRRAQQQRPDERSELSVQMELQADCLTGVWGSAANRRGLLERGDVEEGLRAAAAIGDDRIQSMSGRGVRPESFTHGSSEQRVEWLGLGLKSGDPNSCRTF